MELSLTLAEPELKNIVPQTAFLPEVDAMVSMSYKQYLARIDVAMGGRVAEELSQTSFHGSFR